MQEILFSPCICFSRFNPAVFSGKKYKPYNSITKRGGVCNPAAYVLCEVTVSETAQNVTDGITNPVRLGLRIIEGTLPKRIVSLVLEWAFEHREELLSNWELASEKKAHQQDRTFGIEVNYALC